MIFKSVDELHGIVVKILLAAGADERNAEVVAEHLASANLGGVDSHGVLQLPGYVAGIKAGEIVPTAWPEVLSETPSSALLTGNWTFGQVAAKYAMEIALAKAEKQNIAVVGLVQAHHIGRLGYYAEMATAKQIISMIWAGGYAEEKPGAVPYGGREAVLHTNPLALGFPAGDESPMIIDYATSAASGVKIVWARDRNEPVPLGWIVDKDGNPTTNPNDFFSGGASLAFGGHKGYALMMAVEFLGRILAGSDTFAEAHRGGIYMRHQGVTMIALRADTFQPFTDYARRVDEMERRVRAIPPAPGFKEVLVPGDPEHRTRALRQRDGIPIPDDIWQQLTDTATSIGLRLV